MLELICLFFPSFISILIDKKINIEKTANRPEPLSALLLKYPAYVIVNNLILLLALCVKNRHNLPITSDIFTIDLLTIYLAAAAFVAFFTPFLGKYLFTNFTINFSAKLPKKYQRKKRKLIDVKIVHDNENEAEPKKPAKKAAAKPKKAQKAATVKTPAKKTAKKSLNKEPKK